MHGINAIIPESNADQSSGFSSPPRFSSFSPSLSASISVSVLGFTPSNDDQSSCFSSLPEPAALASVGSIPSVDLLSSAFSDLTYHVRVSYHLANDNKSYVWSEIYVSNKTFLANKFELSATYFKQFYWNYSFPSG